MKLQGMEFVDKELIVIELKPYSSYLVDGEVVNVERTTKRIEVVNPYDIRLVKTTNFIKHYSDGKTIMSQEDYIEKKCTLGKAYSDYEEEWDSLEDEFAFRKFMEVWQPVYESQQIISEPIKVSIVRTQYDTGNPYIKNAYLALGKEKPQLFIYKRQEAICDIVEKCFISLGMTEVFKNISYDDTNNKKIWSRGGHTGVRFLVAFGTYVFDQKWDVKYDVRGTLEDCQSHYEKDKKELETIIHEKYLTHFGRFNDNTFDHRTLLKRLETITRNLDSLDVKKSALDDLSYIQREVRKAKEMILSHLEQ